MSTSLSLSPSNLLNGFSVSIVHCLGPEFGSIGLRSQVYGLMTERHSYSPTLYLRSERLRTNIRVKKEYVRVRSCNRSQLRSLHLVL